MDRKAYLTQIRERISVDDLNAALQQLQQLLANSPLLDEAILQAARFADIRKQIRLGKVSYANANLTKNQIRDGLLELLREIETQSEQDQIKEEINEAVSILNSKNVVQSSNISAGGDVHIGDKNTTQNADKIYNINNIDNANFS